MSYEDQLIREQTGEYDGRELHWCSRCECEAEDCACNDDQQYSQATLLAAAKGEIVLQVVGCNDPSDKQLIGCKLKPEFLADVPAEVRIALAVLLNHVEPGFENCKTWVRAWLKLIEHEGPK